MKKITSYLVCAVMAIMMVACGNNSSSDNEIQSADDSQLREIVEEVNKTCPVSAGAGISMDGLIYENHEVTITYILEDGFLDFDGIRANEKAFHDNMLVSYANNSEKGFKMVLDAIIEADAGMNLVFKSTSGESYSLHFTAEELRANRPDANADPEKLLKTLADNARLQTPQVIEEGVVMTDVILDENYFTYLYSCDESIIDMDILKENKDMVKASILEGLDSYNTLFKQMCELLKTSHRKLAYKYVGSTSGKTVTVYVNPEEVQ